MKLIFCLILGLAAFLPKAFSDVQNTRNYGPIRQAEAVANNEKDVISNMADSNQNVEWTLKDDCTLRKALEHLLARDMALSPTFRTLDPIGGGHLLRRDTVLDSIGGGHLLKRDSVLDSIGGGHLLKKRNELRMLDSIGGGHLLKRENGIRQLDPIGGGNLLKRRYAMYGSFGAVDTPQRRGGKTLDTLAGHSFGTSKRFNAKRNFDEIDSAGFNDFSKRNFDEIDRAGFNDLSKRNFDEIDRAGFNDLSKRNFDEIDRAGFNDLSKRNFDEIDNAGFKDYLRKRNFDEIDAAGFNDFSKRASTKASVVRQDSPAETYRRNEDVKDKKNFDEIDAAGFNDFSKRADDEFLPYHPYADYNDGSDLKYFPFNSYLNALRYKILNNLAPYYEQYKMYRENTPNSLSKRVGGGDYPPVFSKTNVGKYNDMPPKYSPYYTANQDEYTPYYPPDTAPYTPPYYPPNTAPYTPYTPPYNPPYTPPYTPPYNPNSSPYRPPYYPTKPEKTYNPVYFNFLLKAIKYYKNKGLDGLKNESTPNKDEPAFYRRADSKRAEYKRNDNQATEPKTHR